MAEINCWNEIGVWAQEGATCPKLDTLIHCRNCSIYADAGRATLERPISQNSLTEYTEEYARVLADRTLEKLSIMVFRIGEEWLALPASGVQEITDIGPVHSLPHNHNKILEGITSMRGELQLAVSLHALLGIDRAKRRLREGTSPVFPRLILLKYENHSFAFPVEDVAGIFDYAPEQLHEVPETLGKTARRFVSNLIAAEDKRIGLLDTGLVAYGFSQVLT